jgi:pimeloyl-ACP methyl ester carboxylesterase
LATRTEYDPVPSSAPPVWFRRALETPVVSGTSVAADGRQLAWRRWGAGPRVVVLVHGGAAHARWWDHVAPLLLDGATTVLACDLAGHGDSEPRAEYQLDTWADDVVGLALDPRVVGAGASPPVLVGHSMGGQVTWTAAARHGRRLHGVIMIDAPIGDREYVRKAPERTIKPHRRYDTRDEILSRFRTLPEQDTVLEYVLAHLAETSIREAPEGWHWKHDPAVLRRPFWTNAVPDPRACRLALLRAERGIVRQRTLDFIANDVDAAVTVVHLPGAEHHVMLDQPVRLAATVRELVSEWGSPAICG